jgi:hypothetical protein
MRGNAAANEAACLLVGVQGIIPCRCPRRAARRLRRVSGIFAGNEQGEMMRELIIIIPLVTLVLILLGVYAKRQANRERRLFTTKTPAARLRRP